jgi:hypothetical protein
MYGIRTKSEEHSFHRNQMAAPLLGSFPFGDAFVLN